MTYLLDTNQCSHIMAGHPAVTAHLRAIPGRDIVTSVIVYGELVHMAAFSDRSNENLQRLEAFIQSLVVVSIDAGTAAIYGRLKADLLNHFGPKERAKRRQTVIADLGISDNDLWIAATALHHGLIVVSNDSDFGRISQVQLLQIEDWMTPYPYSN